MKPYKDAWALITGASSGIGECFARTLAARGANLILTARRGDVLSALADELRAAHSIRTCVIAEDLTDPQAPSRIYDKVVSEGHRVSVLVNNAGFGVYGRLDETPQAQNRRMLEVNVCALSALTHLFLPDMAKARSGRIFNIASTAAFQPLSYMANYAASKAFVLSFSEALWAEYRGLGVHVLAVCPGATRTPFFDVMGGLPLSAAFGLMDSPQNVVDKSLVAMEKGKSYVIAGPWRNYVLAQLSRLAPRAFVAGAGERMLRPRKG